MSKKPDNVPWDEENNRWVANILPYPSSLGSPKIVPEDLTPWKNNNSSKANDYIKAKYEEIRKEMEILAEEYSWNRLVYESKISFEPLVGNVYHLYKSKSGENFLSLISPNEWGENYLGSFTLSSNGLWVKVFENE